SEGPHLARPVERLTSVEAGREEEGVVGSDAAGVGGAQAVLPAPGAAAAGGEVELLQAREPERAHVEPVGVDPHDGGPPVRELVEEGARPVDRIDVPGRGAAGRAGSLLGADRVAGEVTVQPLDDRLLRGAVGVGYLGAVRLPIGACTTEPPKRHLAGS